MQLIDLTGKKFARLTVLSRVIGRKDEWNHPYWHCRCECGNETEVNGHDLKRFRTQSCGCLRGISRRRRAS